MTNKSDIIDEKEKTMMCKIFGCKFIQIKTEQPIEVMQKIRYTFYEECERCKSKINYSSYLQ